MMPPRGRNVWYIVFFDWKEMGFQGEETKMKVKGVQFRCLPRRYKMILYRFFVAVIFMGLGAAPYASAASLVGYHVTLKAVNGKYVSASNTDNLLIANRSAVGTYETFEVVDAGSGQVGLKCLGNSRYVCAENAGGLPLEATRSSIGTWEKFSLTDLGNQKIGFAASINRLFVSAEDGGAGALIANRSSIRTWETFTWVRVNQDSPVNNTVLPGDVTFVRPENSGPVVSPIFGYNWTSGLINRFREEGENWYEWPIYDRSSGNRIMDRNTPEYWDTFVDELLLGRVTVISFHHRGPKIGDMHVSHLTKFIDAAVRAGVRDQFKISYFEDTGMHANNLPYSSNGATGSQMNCSDRKHQEYLYLDYYKVFFKTIPRDMWYTHNGRPVISAWNLLSDFKNRQDASVMLNYCANRFKQDFGVTPLWILQKNWFEYDPRLNNAEYVLGKHNWFSKASKINYTYTLHKDYMTGVISPGYKNEVSKIDDGNAYVMERWINGKNMAREAFEKGKDADLILLESWTNLVESSGFYRSDDWLQPTEYINLVRHYTDPFPKSLRFQAEGADDFYDTTPSTNTLGGYSKLGLDVKRFEVVNSSGKLTESGWYVDDIQSGEWLEYSNVEVGSGSYRFTARIATNGTGKKMKLNLPGASVVELPDTKGAFQLVHLGQINLGAGKHNFRLNFYSSGIKVDWFFMKKSAASSN